MRRPKWNKATVAERRKMRVEEICKQEEAARWVRAVFLGEQGEWTQWDRVEKRRISWKDPWSIDAKQLSFIIRATYDILPTPTKFLKSLASTLKEKHIATNYFPPASDSLQDIFVHEGAKVTRNIPTLLEHNQLWIACHWKMQVDIG